MGRRSNLSTALLHTAIQLETIWLHQYGAPYPEERILMRHNKAAAAVLSCKVAVETYRLGHMARNLEIRDTISKSRMHLGWVMG